MCSSAISLGLSAMTRLQGHIELHLRGAVEESRRGSLALWVGQLDRKLKAQRQVTGHEEPGHTQTNTL